MRYKVFPYKSFLHHIENVDLEHIEVQEEVY